MFKRFAITLLATGCLCGTYGLYALWVTPLVQREAPEVKQQPPQQVERSGKRGEKNKISIEHLPDVQWSWDALYQFHDGNRYMFTNEWERKPEAGPGEPNTKGEIEFTPFAMVMINEKDPEGPPYTLVCRSAVLRFENGFESTNYNPGRIVGGSLNGGFEIRGPDGLRLWGDKSFVFQENPDPDRRMLADTSPRAFCDGDVFFEYQGHRGTGHGLELKLIPDHATESRDKPAIAGIDTIRLRDHVEMHLLKKGSRPGQPDERVQVNSDGPFVFDMTANTVSFSDIVRVVRRTLEGVDTLDSDVLHIVFREIEVAREVDAQVEELESDPPREKKSTKLEFSRLLATGRRVLLKSQRSNVNATMQELTYDGDEKQIVMKDSHEVHVRQKNNEFFCPELTLNHDDDNEIISILGRGAGHMDSRDPETNMVIYHAKWQKQIWKRPDLESGQQILEFQEVARLLEYEKMGIEADLIRIWMDEDKEPSAARGADDVDDVAGAARKMKIQRLLARTNVAFATPELFGNTKKLEIWFEEGKIPRFETAELAAPVPRDQLVKLDYEVRQRGPATRTRRDTVAGKTSPVGRGLSKQGRAQALASTEDEISAPAIETPAEQGVELPPEKLRPAPPKKKEPYHVDADRIAIRVIREGKEHHVADVRSLGHVLVKQEQGDGEEPFTIDCHTLEIQNEDTSRDHQNIKIGGVAATDRVPEIRAHVRDRGMHVEGLKIRVNRRENRVIVDSPGLMQQPVSNTLDGRTLQTPELLTVWWNDKMEFDGTVAKYFDNVRIVHEDSTVSCGQMVVELTNRVSLIQREGAPRQEAEIRKITCRDGVRLDGRQFEGNRLIGIHHGEMFELTMDQVTGEMESSRGGWFEFWRRDSANGGFSAPSVSASSNRSVRSGEIQEWNYTKITFRGEMTGNVDSLSNPNRSVTTKFHDDVVVVYGPVKLPTEVIDPDDLPEKGGRLSSSTLRLRQLPASEQSPERYITLLATGNAELSAGRSFFGRADEVTFDESKKQYILRTAAKQGYSEIWRQGPYQGKRAYSKAQEFIFYPDSGELQVIGGSSLDGQN